MADPVSRRVHRPPTLSKYDRHLTWHMTSADFPAVASLKELISRVEVTPGGLMVVLDWDRLTLASARRGWSLSELATRADVSRPVLGAIRRGARIRPRSAFKISDALRRP